MRQDVWIVIAAYNEGTIIRAVVQSVRDVWRNIAVVDDGSTDRTGEEAEKGGASVIRHPINLGQGAALATGIEYALRMGAKYIVTFDADGQHRVSDIESVVQPVVNGEAEMAIGSRFLGGTEAMPLSRRLTLKAAILFTRITSGLKMTDAHNGLRCFSASAAKRIRISQNRMAHASEIIDEIAHHQIRFVEVPVTIVYTEYSLAKGQSIFNSLHILVDLLFGRILK